VSFGTSHPGRAGVARSATGGPATAGGPAVAGGPAA